MSKLPDARATSVQEVLAIADALERAAAARYAKLADMMQRVGRDDLAATFRALAAEEQHHIDGVQRLLGGMQAAARPADLRRWLLPETFGVVEAGPPALLTPYRALSIAVRAEERAFSFWTYVASTAEDEAVRIQAEDMAKQELVHAAKLRHARRRAYHEQYPYGRRAAESRSYTDPAAVKLELAALEDGVRAPLAEIARRLEQVPDLESARVLRDVIVEVTGAAPTREHVREADLHHRIHWAATTGSKGLLFEAEGLLERMAERGIDMLDAADAAAAVEIQTWVDRIISAVSRLNARLYALEPSLAEVTADADDGRSATTR